MSELDKKFNLVDETTPIGEFLSAHYKRFNSSNSPFCRFFNIMHYLQEFRPLYYQGQVACDLDQCY